VARDIVKPVGCSNCTIRTRPKELIKDLDKTLRSSSPTESDDRNQKHSFPA
jgi:hypothetical protein